VPDVLGCKLMLPLVDVMATPALTTKECVLPRPVWSPSSTMLLLVVKSRYTVRPEPDFA
jgi:hypothetical protein